MIPTLMVLLSSALALPLTLLGWAAGQPEHTVTLVFPLAAVLWLEWRRHYRIVLFPDRLERFTWCTHEVFSFQEASVEICTPSMEGRTARTAHLPCLRLRKCGRVILSIPSGVLGKQAASQMADFFRRQPHLLVGHISFLT